MATETNDKYPHKPSAKHTLEEVRKSLEDLVRNEFDDVEPAPKPVRAAETDATPEDDKAHRSLSNLPRRKPAGLDTTQLLRSLKGLISDELSAGDGAPAHPHRGDEGAVVEHDDEPASVVSARRESFADADAFSGIDTKATEAAPAPPVPGPEPDASEAVATRSRESEMADEGEEITLEVAPVPEQALAPDADNEERGDSPLEALEKVTETLGEARLPSPISADEGERDTARPAPAETPRDRPGGPPAPEPTTEPWSQLPLLKVVDLPETRGTQRAFAVQDPVFAGDPGHSALPGEGQLADAMPAPPTPPMFISQWLDEDPARQATDPGLGLFAEETDAAMELPSAPATPRREEAPTGDLEEAAPGPVKAPDTGAELTGIDEETADVEPTRESSADQPGRGEIDMLEIPGGDVVDEDTAEAEITLPAPDIDDPEAKATELTREIPEETPMPNDIPSADADEQADIDLSAEPADEPDTAIDRPAEREHARAERSSSNKEQEAGSRTSVASPAPEIGRGEVKREHRTTLGQADNSFMKMTAIDFNAEPSPAEEKSSGSAPESGAPSFNPKLDLAVQPGESDVELPPPDEPKATVETPPSPPLSLVEESSPDLHSKDLKAKETVETPPSLPSSPVQESSPAVRSKVADKGTVPSKRPRADSPQPSVETQRRLERPAAKSKSDKLELALEPNASQQPAAQDAAQQTQPASGVPEWYRRPFKIEQVAPVKPPEPRTKAPSQEARAKSKSPAFGAPDKIPVLDAVVTGRERPKAKTPGVKPERERPKAPPSVREREPSKAKTPIMGGPVKTTPPATQKAGRRDSAAARSLAIQIVAKLNMELRKCGERALSPAIVDRLQYLLREALAQGGSDVDNSKNKKL